MFAIEKNRMVMIGSLIKNISGLEFIWNFQNNDEIVHPYLSGRLVSASSNLMNDRILSEIVEDDVVLSVSETIRSIEEYIIYLKGKGTGVNQILKILTGKLKLQSSKDSLSLAGVSFIDCTPVIDLTGLVGTKYIEEASVDVRIRTSMEVSGQIEKIEQIIIN